MLLYIYELDDVFYNLTHKKTKKNEIKKIFLLAKRMRSMKVKRGLFGLIVKI
jgi:hypothetical protein